MNFKSTAALFGLLLGMLWLFGLMLAYKKTVVDENIILPSLERAKEFDITEVTIRRPGPDKKPEEFQLTLRDDIWTLRQPNVKQSLRLEGFVLDKLVGELKSMKRSDETVVEQNPAEFDLDPPKTTVTLKGTNRTKQEKTWKVYLGKESADKLYVFANSSDKPGRVFPVLRSSLGTVLFKDASHLRSKNPFRFQDTQVEEILLKSDKNAVDLKRDSSGNWQFETPKLGFADSDGAVPGKKEESKGGIKGLFAALTSLRVDDVADFVPAKDVSAANFGLEEGKEKMRIEITKVTDKTKKESSKEALLIGDTVSGKVYARLAGDDGIFKLNAKLLDPVTEALTKPETLRSLDMSFFDIKKVDALVIKYGKDETKVWSVGDTKTLQMQTGAGKIVKADDKAVQSFLEALQGKRDIQKFYDEPDVKKIDVELGFDAPMAEIAVYVDGLDKDAKDQDGKDKDSKKDDKKDSKKTEGPIFKKDMKPAVVLSFGKSDKDQVNVKRVFADGTTSRFTVAKAVLDKVAPPQGALVLLDKALPSYQSEEIVALKLQRGGQKMEIVKGEGEQSHRWFFKEATATAAPSQADTQKTGAIVNVLAILQAKKWLRKIADGEDLDKFGLKNPTLIATLQVKRDRLGPAAVATVSSLLAGPIPWSGLMASSVALANRDPGDSIDLKIGKETDQDKDKPGFFAQHSGSDLLFLVAPELVKSLRETDLHDRTSVVQGEAYLAVALLGLGASEPQSGWLFASPLASGQVQTFDAAKVKEVKFAVRTPLELRSFAFERNPKEKTWQEKTGLQEFSLDADKLDKLLKELGELKAERFVSLDGQKPEHKLGPKDYQLKIDVILEGDKTLTLTVGAAFERLGYFSHASAWPDAVFLLPAAKIDPLLRGVGYFAKDRVAGAR